MDRIINLPVVPREKFEDISEDEMEHCLEVLETMRRLEIELGHEKRAWLYQQVLSDLYELVVAHNEEVREEQHGQDQG